MERQNVVDDFPLWLKIIVWLIVEVNSDLDHHGHGLLWFHRLIEEFFSTPAHS
jgi:hypothetical protein